MCIAVSCIIVLYGILFNVYCGRRDLLCDVWRVWRLEVGIISKDTAGVVAFVSLRRFRVFLVFGFWWRSEGSFC